MASPKAIIMGWINEGCQAQCGETVKNQHIISQLRNLGVEVITLDFYKWKKHPWVILKFFASLLLYPKSPLILSTAPKNVYFIMKWHRFLRSSRKIIHWVIGGNLHKLVQNGEIKAKYLQNLYINIVETNEMLDTLNAEGVDNVVQLPNFKPITYTPESHRTGSKIRFVFLSRIKPEKGVDYIIQSARALNAKGLAHKYEIDFYGRIDDDYRTKFLEDIKPLPNVSYSGFLDLNHNEGYDKLAEYSALLFPTFWKSEGFAGIFIDAFISGLPVIASDWAHNANIIDDGITGIIVSPMDAAALGIAMEKVVHGEVNLQAMSYNCRAEAMAYDVANVVTPSFLHQIGIM